MILSVVFVGVILLVGAVCRKMFCPTMFCPNNLGGSYVSVRLEENIAEVAEQTSLKSISAPGAGVGTGSDTGAAKHEDEVLEGKCEDATVGAHGGQKKTSGTGWAGAWGRS